MKYIGHLEGSFKDKVSGNDIKYAKLFVTFTRDDVVGVACKEIKCKTDLIPELKKLKPDQEIEVFYDQYQRAVKVV